MRVELAIQRLDDDGRGVGQADGRELHVPGALPGERVAAELEHQSPHAARGWGRLLAVLATPSPDRVAPLCAAHGQCGGCALQHLAPAAQLAFKTARARAALAAAGVAWPDLEAIPASAAAGTRNRAKWIIAPGPSLASYAPHSHDLVDMAGCRALEPVLQAAHPVLRGWLAATRLAVHDERQGTGELRYCLARASASGELQVLVITHSAAARPVLAAAVPALVDALPGLGGLHWQANPSRGGALLGTTPAICLHGAPSLIEEVGELRLALSPTAFFQVERVQAARMIEEVAAQVAAPGGRVVDLYCGVGGFALGAARRGARVVGIEVNAAAVDDARQSARLSGLAATATFIPGDAGDGLPAAAALLGGVDAVIADPPRKGLSAAARAAILALAPARVALVSCEPRTLTTDLGAFIAAGYQLRHAVAYDLMPGTPEVETVVILAQG
jgi:23S rRNA (uracil1939-C5)-methyltransferase